MERQLRAEEELCTQVRRLRRRLGRETFGVRLCLKAVLEEGNIHSPIHKVKHALVCELMAEGHSEASIVSAFFGMAGFLRTLTAYMVRHSFRKGYNPYTYEKLILLGVCLKDPGRCPIYGRR